MWCPTMAHKTDLSVASSLTHSHLLSSCHTDWPWRLAAIGSLYPFLWYSHGPLLCLLQNLHKCHFFNESTLNKIKALSYVLQWYSQFPIPCFSFLWHLPFLKYYITCLLWLLFIVYILLSKFVLYQTRFSFHSVEWYTTYSKHSIDNWVNQ